MYIGVNGRARKVKKIYIGVNDVAREVVKGYIGWGGIARRWWGGPEDVPKQDEFLPIIRGAEWCPNDIRRAITRISLVDSHTPSNPDDSWAIGPDGYPSVKAYRYGTEIIISGDGSGVIYLPEDASCIFGGYEDEVVSSPDVIYDFYNLTEINGLNILDTSRTKDFSLMFGLSAKLSELDLTSFDTRNVESYTQMFWGCNRLWTIKVSSDKWTIPFGGITTEGCPASGYTFV